jgi:hypothetical protein
MRGSSAALPCTSSMGGAGRGCAGRRSRAPCSCRHTRACERRTAPCQAGQGRARPCAAHPCTRAAVGAGRRRRAKVDGVEIPTHPEGAPKVSLQLYVVVLWPQAPYARAAGRVCSRGVGSWTWRSVLDPGKGAHRSGPQRSGTHRLFPRLSKAGRMKAGDASTSHPATARTSGAH